MLKDAVAAQGYIDWGKGLGESLSLQLLPQLRTANIEALSLLASAHKPEWVQVDHSQLAVVVPARKEAGNIGHYLLSLSEEFNRTKLPKRPIVVIVINGEGMLSEKSATFKAVNYFLGKNKQLPMAIKPLLLPGEGKLYAHSEALKYLSSFFLKPEKVMFCDADHLLGPGSVKGMINLINQGADAASIGLKTQNKDHAKGIGEKMDKMASRGQNTALRCLQGGAFTISASTVPYYQAFCEAFPGMFSNDTNWTYFLIALGKKIAVDQSVFTTMEITKKSSQELRRQHLRWVQGWFQALAIIDPAKLPFSQAIMSEIKKMKAQELVELAGVAVYSAGLILQVLRHSPPPNFFKNQSWQPPR